MTVPPQGPPPSAREQWGTGLPGIPSIWDTAPTSAPTSAPSAWPVPVERPLRRERTRSAARRWLWVAIGLTVLLAAGSVVGSSEQAAVTGSSSDVAVPLPQGAPPPGPFGVVPAPEAVGPGTGLVARRTDGGEPFGLALGETVVLTEPGVASQIDVRALSAVRDGGRLLVDVAMQTPSSTTGGVLVPAFLLRLPDGRELAASGLTDGQDVPALLGPGLAWQGTLVFDAAGGPAVLVLENGGTLAGWSVP